MSIQAVVGFWQAVQKDPALQRRIDPRSGFVPALHAGDPTSELEGLSRVAREAGFDCSAEELRAAEAVIRFWGLVAERKDLQQQLMPAGTMERPAAVSLIFSVAKQAGFKFTMEQLDTVTKAHLMAAAAAAEPSDELDNEELEAVAGGIIIVGGAPSAQAAFNGGWQRLSQIAALQHYL